MSNHTGTVTLTVDTIVRRYLKVAPWLTPSEIRDAVIKGGMCPISYANIRVESLRGCFYTLVITNDPLSVKPHQCAFCLAIMRGKERG